MSWKLEKNFSFSYAYSKISETSGQRTADEWKRKKQVKAIAMLSLHFYQMQDFAGFAQSPSFDLIF